MSQFDYQEQMSQLQRSSQKSPDHDDASEVEKSTLSFMNNSITDSFKTSETDKINPKQSIFGNYLTPFEKRTWRDSNQSFSTVLSNKTNNAFISKGTSGILGSIPDSSL